jgi:hypothetical protein
MTSQDLDQPAANPFGLREFVATKTSPRLSDKSRMTIGSASVQGIHDAESLLNATAVKVANQTTSPVSDEVSLSEDAVALLQARSDVAANVNAFNVASEMQKTLLSILA